MDFLRLIGTAIAVFIGIAVLFGLMFSSFWGLVAGLFLIGFGLGCFGVRRRGGSHAKSLLVGLLAGTAFTLITLFLAVGKLLLSPEKKPEKILYVIDHYIKIL